MEAPVIPLRDVYGLNLFPMREMTATRPIFPSPDYEHAGQKQDRLNASRPDPTVPACSPLVGMGGMG